MSITPDLIEWLLADQKVCQSWKKLGVRMNLSCYIGYIQSQEKSNSASLRMLLRLWSSAKPESYNVKSLKRVLAAEGLHHMWLWISLMTQRESRDSLSRRIQESNSRTLTRNHSRSMSSTTTSPWSKYLYTNQTQDPGYTSDYFSSCEYQSPDTSRSSSRQDFYSGYTSCPTTPINNRKKFDFSFVTENKKSTPQDIHDSFSRSNSSSRANDRTNSSSRINERSNSSSRINDRESRSFINMKNKSPKHARSSSLSRLPKLEKLTSPRIVETEIWKKEIYKKVTEEVRDYSYSAWPCSKPKLTKSGSLPNLPNYITSIDIQVVPSRTIKFPKKKERQSEHEKEILKLCGDIITELKPAPVNIDIDIDSQDENQTYAKINKVSIKHSEPQSQNQPIQNKPEDKFISVKNVQIEVEEPKTLDPIGIKIKQQEKKVDLPNFGNSGGFFQSMIEEEKRSKKFEIDDASDDIRCMGDIDSDASSISDVETVKSYNSGTLPSNQTRIRKDTFDVSKNDLGGGYFENLVSILQEAVKDISR